MVGVVLVVVVGFAVIVVVVDVGVLEVGVMLGAGAEVGVVTVEMVVFV